MNLRSITAPRPDFAQTRPSRSSRDPAPAAASVHRHAAATIALHWISALAVAVCAGAAIGREWVEVDRLRDTLLALHRQAGLLVMLLLAARLAVRFRRGMADHAGRMHPLLKLAAHGAHLALYAMLLALPLLGVATSQAHEVKVRLFGLLTLPDIVPADPDLAEKLSDWHIAASWGLLALLAAHVAAALWHHWARRDGVLAAMLPLLPARHGRD